MISFRHILALSCLFLFISVVTSAPAVAKDSEGLQVQVIAGQEWAQGQGQGTSLANSGGNAGALLGQANTDSASGSNTSSGGSGYNNISQSEYLSAGLDDVYGSQYQNAGANGQGSTYNNAGTYQDSNAAGVGAHAAGGGGTDSSGVSSGSAAGYADGVQGQIITTDG